MLTTAARTVGELAYPERIEEMDKELSKVIDEFDRAVNVEALRLAKDTGRCSLSQSGESPLSIGSCRATGFAWTAQTCRHWL